MTAYRVLVTGSRNWRRAAAIHRALDHAHHNMLYEHNENGLFVVVHGTARGADAMAGWYANECNWQVEAHPANWAQHGKRAGMIRNQHMVNLGAALCLAFIRDHSSGASRCADMAQHARIPTLRIHDCGCHPNGGAA